MILTDVSNLISYVVNIGYPKKYVLEVNFTFQENFFLNFLGVGRYNYLLGHNAKE
jgi:hypothetical protein